MAGSLLNSFVSGTRQVLTIQLLISVGAIGMAGWTLGVTNELIRERDRLRERVIQLEQTIGGSGIVVPETPAVVEGPPPTETPYPGEVDLTQVVPVEETPTDEESKPPNEPRDEPTQPEQPTVAAEQPNIGAILGSLFAPPPPIRTIVLHVRDQADSGAAQRIARSLQQQEPNASIVIDVMPPRDPRESGYAYFDGRQSRGAAALVTRFHDIARELEIAAWSAQLRGVALPAQGEYTADRLDLVLPPLPQAQPNFQLQRVDPRVLRRETAPQPIR